MVATVGVLFNEGTESAGRLLIKSVSREGGWPSESPVLAQPRPEKALVGRAQRKISQPPSLEKTEQAWKEHV
jgi:hypothetical protein